CLFDRSRPPSLTRQVAEQRATQETHVRRQWLSLARLIEDVELALGDYAIDDKEPVLPLLILAHAGDGLPQAVKIAATHLLPELGDFFAADLACFRLRWQRRWRRRRRNLSRCR